MTRGVVSWRPLCVALCVVVVAGVAFIFRFNSLSGSLGGFTNDQFVPGGSAARDPPYVRTHTYVSRVSRRALSGRRRPGATLGLPCFQ